MKKLLIYAAIAAVVLIAAAGVTTWAFAQDPTPACPGGAAGNCGEQGGRMGGRGGFGGQAGEDGLLHDIMFPALAEALGMTPEALQAAHDSGQTFYNIAAAQGLTVEEAQALMADVRAQALEQAVADGVITQEQADWMAQRMQGGMGYGRGACGGQTGSTAQGGMMGGRGGRWSAQP